MEKTKVSVKEETKKENVQGKLTYEDKVIQKIIGISLEKVEGLLTVDGGFFSNLAGKLVNTDDVTSGVVVEVGEKQVAVDLDIVAEYGKDIYKIPIPAELGEAPEYKPRSFSKSRYGSNPKRRNFRGKNGNNNKSKNRPSPRQQN